MLSMGPCGGNAVQTRHCRRLVVLIAIVFFGAGLLPAFAQMPTATILGAVKDSTGGVVPGATITIRNTDTGLSRISTSAENGSYRFSALPVGPYEIRVELSGFKPQVRQGVTLTISQEAVINFAMEVGGIEEAIAVTAEAPQVNTTTGSLGALVDEHRVTELPLNGRNYVDLTLMQPGVAQHQNVGATGVMSGTWFSSGGAPVRSNNYMLDGAMMANLYGATSASISNSTLGVEGIQEFRVETNSFSAEYGMAMGSQMMIVSKSGSNQFRGSVFEFMRHQALDARNYFDRRTAPKPPFRKNNFGVAFGGPIVRDKTLFFGVYEGLRESLGRTIITNTLPNEARVDGGLVPQIAPAIKPLLDLFPRPNLPKNQYTFPFTQRTRENFEQIRVDHNLSTTDNFFGRFTETDAFSKRPRDYPQFLDTLNSKAQFTTFSESHLFSSSLLNTARVSISRTILGGDSVSGLSGPQYAMVPGLEMGSVNIGGVTGFGPDAADPVKYQQRIITWSDDLFYTRGRHSMKFGTLVNQYAQDILLNINSKGTVSFPNITAFLQGRPSVYTAATPGSVQHRIYRFTTFGVYGQDDLKLRSNLTLNLGVRYEFMRVPHEISGRGAALRDIARDATTTPGLPFENPSLGNVSPRLGFAWDVAGNGLTAVRGGFGILYEVGNLGSSLLQAAIATPPYSSSSSVANPPTFALPLPFPREAVGRSLRTLDYHLGQPHLYQYNLTLERQLPFNIAARLGYAGSRGFELMQQTEGNPIPATTTLPNGQKYWSGTGKRVNPNWDSIMLFKAGSESWYNSFQFLLMKRLSKGLEFQSSYTYAKALDEPQGQLPADNNATSSYPTDPLNLALDKGPASFDVPHNWRFNWIYQLPGSSAGGVGALLRGWRVSGIVTLQSGYPFTPVLNSNRSRSGVGGGGGGIDRPDLKAGRTPDSVILGGVTRYFDPTAFTIPAAGTLGSAGRNSLRGPGLSTVDLSLVKDTAVPGLGPRSHVEFRVEAFNVFNRANFAVPNRVVFAGVRDVEDPLPTAGLITRTSTAARQVQLAVKLLF